MIPRDVLSVEQVAEILGCKRRRVFQLLADGTLEKAPRFGRSIRVFADSVARAQNPTPAARRQARRSVRRLAPIPAELLA